MGVRASTQSTEDREKPTRCPSARRMHPGAIAYWRNARERQAAFVAGRLFRGEKEIWDIMACVSEASPAVYLKGGAAAWLHLHPVRSSTWPQLGSGAEHVEQIADLDFGILCPDRASLQHVVPEIVRTLPGISDIAARGNLLGRFEKAWPTWKIRMDGLLGESFQAQEKRPMGALSLEEGGRRVVPMKVTHHAACRDKNTGNDFDLLRIGLAVWNEPLRLQTVVPFVDLCASSAPPATVHVEGIRVQTIRSLLRELRRLLFHETNYRPWCSIEGFEAKLERRCTRLVQLSVLSDYNEEGDRDVAAKNVRQQWLDALPRLFAARGERICSHARTAPRQLKYFLLVCARACAQAVGPDASEAYHHWLHNVFVPRLEVALQRLNRSRV